MIRIVLLGAGNVATHLAETFLASGALEILQIYNRTEYSLLPFHGKIKTTTSLAELADADCYIISIADDGIAAVSDALPFSDKLVVHTSGSVAMEELNPKNRRGVFYPLQTFSRNHKVDFSEVPICIEAESKKDALLLEEISNSIAGKSYFINSEQRQKLHLAAVFVCNFVNHLYHIGYEITKENNIPFTILKPLIKETARKIEDAIPSEVQTGPAKRNDKKIIAKQLESLHLQEHKEIYDLLTNAITDYYGRKKL